MIRVYNCSPKNLTLFTDNTLTSHPLTFSATQLNWTSHMPVGIIAKDGEMCLSPHDDLPVFVRHANGRADILLRPDIESITESDFLISGIVILTSDGNEVDTSHSRWLRPLDLIPRIALGLSDKGQVSIFFGVANIATLKNVICSYNIDTSVLLASGDVYFNNPREGVTEGTIPVTTLRVDSYQEISRPIIVIDPAHGGTDIGNISELTTEEKHLTLAIAVEMKRYMDETYTGNFMLTRKDDSFIPYQKRASFCNGLQADFVYSLHCNTFDSMSRGIEVNYGYKASPSTKQLVTALHKELAYLLEMFGITTQGANPKLLDRYDMFNSPMCSVQLLYMDNEEDALLLNSVGMVEALAKAQADALARALGLHRKVSTLFATAPLAPPQLYRVNVGQFPFKYGAQKLCDDLRKQGIYAWITKENP